MVSVEKKKPDCLVNTLLINKNENSYFFFQGTWVPSTGYRDNQWL